MTGTTPLPDVQGLEDEEAKRLLRTHVRAIRAQHSPKDRAREAHMFAQHGEEAVADVRTVAAYVSEPGEPDTSQLLGALSGRGVRILLPVLGPGLARAWAYYRGEDDLQRRAPGRPPEPSGPILPADAIRDAEAIITPGLAVDGLGTRLGQGAGWYDRMLALIEPDVPTFTMVFEHEVLRDYLLPRAEFDIPIKAVITPSEWFLLEGSPINKAARALAESAALAR
ncbi:5-formyltetrahydrofolate cyclo-ligase [Bowdeniella nasicola]|uniref:5-formyltetrahydrofolate cyclo-ligase n=1 Tax=Bowdeniella nasicola TaxID=208480 RepID=A0A1H4DSN0_9ACTO|nr:5-formyltetrahydrofolate cyclo-ligase [Bowdeniella nasicola]SEA75785.1 5-formyltetrahydrofolate cyclo-ligase [Bowdeniella nasicola]